MRVDTVEEMFKKIIKDYWEDRNLDKMTSWKDKKYNKSYFKGLETEFLGQEEKAKIEKKVKKEKKGSGY